jgi:hypothetical protein
MQCVNGCMFCVFVLCFVFVHLSVVNVKTISCVFIDTCELKKTRPLDTEIDTPDLIFKTSAHVLKDESRNFFSIFLSLSLSRSSIVFSSNSIFLSLSLSLPRSLSLSFSFCFSFSSIFFSSACNSLTSASICVCAWPAAAKTSSPPERDPPPPPLLVHLFPPLRVCFRPPSPRPPKQVDVTEETVRLK